MGKEECQIIEPATVKCFLVIPYVIPINYEDGNLSFSLTGHR